jgi:selenium-binding protein 1
MLYASPEEASHAAPEEFVYLACLHEGTGVRAPDFLAVIDAEDGRVIHETPMPNVGDELHHFGWNRCSSACHGPDRSHLVLPGFRSSRIHIVNVADDPRRPRIEKVIEPQELVDKTGYTRPHTVHCMPGDNIVISMLGNRDGGGVGGFAVLDARTFEIKGRWENGGERPPLNYDFWYQPRKNVLISSEWGEPNAYEEGF